MPNTTEVAKTFTALCAQGQYDEAGQRYWADDVVSCEAMDGPMARVQGRQGVTEKGAWWTANHEIHSAKVEGPYVNGDQFSLRFTFDVTPKGGQRITMDEHALYTVKDGKIVEERFLYAV